MNTDRARALAQLELELRGALTRATTTTTTPDAGASVGATATTAFSLAAPPVAAATEEAPRDMRAEPGAAREGAPPAPPLLARMTSAATGAATDATTSATTAAPRRWRGGWHDGATATTVLSITAPPAAAAPEGAPCDARAEPGAAREGAPPAPPLLAPTMSVMTDAATDNPPPPGPTAVLHR